MKKLELNQMENLEGGNMNCVTGAIGVVGLVTGILSLGAGPFGVAVWASAKSGAIGTGLPRGYCLAESLD